MWLSKLLLGISLSLSLALAAQDSIPYTPKKTLKNFINPDSLPLMNFSIVPIPILTSSPETGIKLGGALEYFFNAKEKGKNSEARGSYIHGQVTYSTLGQFEIKGTWQVFTKGERFVFRGAGGYSTYNDRFWGLGNQTLAENNFLGSDYRRIFLESRMYRLLKKNWYIGLRLDYNDVFELRFKRPLTISESGLPGINGSKVFGLGPAVLYEARDYPFSAQKGAYAEFYFAHNTPVGGDQYEFNHWLVDLRKYYPVGNGNTFAFQFLTQGNTGNIPLLEMAKMGGAQIMRGYFTGRFRDLSYSAAQAEFRFRIWRWVYGAGFAASGIMGESINQYQLNQTRYAAGGGLRFLVNKKNRMFLRIDYARNSTAGGAYYIRLNEAF